MLAVAFFVSINLNAQVELAKIFTDNMVLQQNQKVKISGTGVNNAGFGQAIAIYPNPVYDKLTISNGDGADIEVYNPLGKLVLSDRVQGEQHVVSMAELKSGFYIVRALKNRLGKSYKVIKQ